MTRLILSVFAGVSLLVFTCYWSSGSGRWDHSPPVPKPPSLEQQCLNARGNWHVSYNDPGSCQLAGVR